MDIRCTKCGEPWELDSLHDVVEERTHLSELTGALRQEVLDDYDRHFSAVRDDFRRRGCEVFGTRHGTVDRGAAMLSDALFDILGDDIVGIASELSDAGY